LWRAAATVDFPVAIPPVMPTADILCCSSAREQEALTSASEEVGSPQNLQRTLWIV
jgi:hypothetical protein